MLYCTVVYCKPRPLHIYNCTIGFEDDDTISVCLMNLLNSLRVQHLLNLSIFYVQLEITPKKCTSDLFKLGFDAL